MSSLIYCWRCQKEVPMLSDEEWGVIFPYLDKATEQIIRYRAEHGCSLAEAREKGFGQEALRIYEQITGYHETCADNLFHHRLSEYGPPCHVCGKPLRTPKAKHCAECGAMRQSVDLIK